jgi:hypothetical protein
MQMSAVSKITEQEYQALVSILSDASPRWGLSPTDLAPESDELDLCIRHYGGAYFVAEALNETFESLAIRVCANDLNQAIALSGIAVVDAVRAAVIEKLIRDIEALRDLERPSKYDRRQEDAEMGIGR